jgi:hypothetical protein
MWQMEGRVNERLGRNVGRSVFEDMLGVVVEIEARHSHVRIHRNHRINL